MRAPSFRPGGTAGLWVPAVFVALALTVGPDLGPAQHRVDEGFSLMKAVLCLRGHALYDEIWCDQPPLLTFLLTQLFRVVGPSAEAGRVLVLCLSAMLLWAFYRTIKQLSGAAAGAFGVALLALSGQYLDLSLRVMIGLPALAFAVLSLSLFVDHVRTGGRGWLIASAVVMALSLQTKLFTLLVVPVFPVAYLVVPRARTTPPARFRPALWALTAWSATVALVWLLIGWAYGIDLYTHLLQPHFNPGLRSCQVGANNLAVLRDMVAEHGAYFVPAGVALAVLGLRRQWHVLLPLTWLVIALTALAIHQPLHDHYLPLLTIPLSWLAALAVQPAVDGLRREWQAWRSRARVGLTPAIASAFLLAFCVGLVVRRPATGPPDDRVGTFTGYGQTVELLRRLGPETRWVFTDLPFVAFASGLPVPPELAVFSGKRWQSGNMNAAALIRQLQRHRPEQILLGRIPLDKWALDFIRSRYACVYREGPYSLFLHRSVAAVVPTTGPGGAPLARAFPGAEGFGAFTPGGRGGKTLLVTTLHDYDPAREAPVPGSLRAACLARGPRTVVFRVAGNISLKAPLVLSEPFLTVAGQSAPGDGICLKDHGIHIRTHDVVLRYLRIRPGDELAPDYRRRALNYEPDALCIGKGGRNIVIDHCSTSWAIDECLSVYGAGVTDVTVQWCLIAESLNRSCHSKGPHGYGSLIRCNGNVSFHHNLFAHHAYRGPRPGTCGHGCIHFDFRNNLVYDARGYTAADPVCMNYVGNYLKRPGGPVFKVGGDATRLFVAGNYLEGGGPKNLDTWKMVARATTGNRVERPFRAAPVTTAPAPAVYPELLAASGAVRPRRDPVDRRVVEETRAGTGRIIDSQAEVGGWPDLRTAPAPLDSDADGMPDDWELAHGLDPHDPADGTGDADWDGYTNIEEWLNCLAEIDAPH